MTVAKFVVLTAASTFCSVALGLDCPRPPEQVGSSWGAEVEATVGRIGPAKGAELAVRAKSATLDLLGRLPQSNAVYLEQMMYAAYCSALRDDRTLREGEKAALLRTYNKEVRQTIRAHSATPASTSSPSTPQKATDKPPPRTNRTQPDALPKPSGNSGAQQGVQVANPASASGEGRTEQKNLTDELSQTLNIRLVGSRWNGNRTEYRRWEQTSSIGQLFLIVGPHLVGRPHDQLVREKITKTLRESNLEIVNGAEAGYSFDIAEADFQIISLTLRRLGLVKVSYLASSGGGAALYWDETELGRNTMYSLVQAGSQAPRPSSAASASSKP